MHRFSLSLFRSVRAFSFSFYLLFIHVFFKKIFSLASEKGGPVVEHIYRSTPERVQRYFLDARCPSATFTRIGRLHAEPRKRERERLPKD